jgi:hypothetical protein
LVVEVAQAVAAAAAVAVVVGAAAGVARRWEATCAAERLEWEVRAILAAWVPQAQAWRQLVALMRPAELMLEAEVVAEAKMAKTNKSNASPCCQMAAIIFVALASPNKLALDCVPQKAPNLAGWLHAVSSFKHEVIQYSGEHATSMECCSTGNNFAKNFGSRVNQSQ